MTREDALLKLLAIEPVARGNLAAITGWGIDATEQVLQTLVARGAVAFLPGVCASDNYGGRRIGLPHHHPAHQQAQGRP